MGARGYPYIWKGLGNMRVALSEEQRKFLSRERNEPLERYLGSFDRLQELAQLERILP